MIMTIRCLYIQQIYRVKYVRAVNQPHGSVISGKFTKRCPICGGGESAFYTTSCYSKAYNARAPACDFRSLRIFSAGCEQVTAEPEVPAAVSATVEPANSDDWEVVEQNAEYMEAQILSQVGNQLLGG